MKESIYVNFDFITVYNENIHFEDLELTMITFITMSSAWSVGYIFVCIK